MTATLIAETAAEDETRQTLAARFRELGYWNPEEAAGASMSIESVADRFETLKPFLRPGPGSRVLVSGMSAGSEMLAALRFGFGEVHGTEVDPFYLELCRKRFGADQRLRSHLYDGAGLSFENAWFDAVVSGHIIEHTRDPFAYLREHLRVLKPGGLLLLEFPTRFHRRELHTQLPSFEWLPRAVRNAFLRVLASRRSPLEPGVKQRYRAIFETGLQQVSTVQVRFWARRSGFPAELIHRVTPSPGVVRCVLRKR
jgi:SAM-dependent methyltransferase